MVYYRIGNILEEVTPPDKAEAVYAAVLSPEEWQTESRRFDMGIEQEVRGERGMTKVEVNYDPRGSAGSSKSLQPAGRAGAGTGRE